MIWLSVWFLVGCLGSAMALLGAIAWYNPIGRTERQLAIPLAHFERTCQDALHTLEEVRKESIDCSPLMHMNAFGGECDKLRKIPKGELALLGFGALGTHAELMSLMDQWDRCDGCVAHPAGLSRLLQNMSKTANGLNSLVSREYMQEAQNRIDKDILVGIVASPPEQNQWIH